MANHGLQELAAELRGQKRWNESRARAVVQQWRASGLSGIEAARLPHVDAQRLYWWRDRLGLRWAPSDARAIAQPGVSFARVVVHDEAACSSSSPIIVEFGDNMRVHVNEANATTAAWVALLASSFVEVST